MNCPLKHFTDRAGKAVPAERTATGWYCETPSGVDGELDVRDGLVCRVAVGADPEVVQLGIGATSSHLCNAVYSPSSDTALVLQADNLVISVSRQGKRVRFNITCDGPLTVTVLADYFRAHRNLPWFQPLDKRYFPRPPAGWCSWYYYYLGITEEEVVKNTDWLADHLQPFGCEWVQIDDGWQGRGEGYGSNRDWFVTSTRDFPHGMRYAADYIRRHNMRPGIWCIPFTQSNSTLYTEQPALFVRNPDGSTPGERSEPLDYEWMLPAEDRMFEWPGRYFIDATGKDGQAYLTRLFSMICDEWGYEYVKIDAQWMMAGFYNQHRRQLANPALNGERAYRYGLKAMKSVMGPRRFLLNCGAALSSDGYCEGIRIGGDVNLNWEGMLEGIRATMRWLFLNTIAFYTDPDVVCVREPLPVEQARIWATLLGITGQLLMASDKMYELPDERVELLRRIFPVADIHPMELYPHEGAQLPGIFDLKVAKEGVGTWDVVALFNWSQESSSRVELSPERLGLQGNRWICLDAWSGKLLHHGDGHLALDLPPATCQVVSYWPALDHPQVVGSSRHLTQGADDLGAVVWDALRLQLSGTARVVGGDPYHLRIFIPDGYQIIAPDLRNDNGLATLTLHSKKNTTMHWHVRFSQE